ncbi:MAG: EthD family reductase [Pseudomonadota bacterium]
MKRVLVCYGQPDDAAAFDRHYSDTHMPLVAKMPHLVSFEASSGPVVSSEPSVDYHLIAILSYANQEDLDASLASPEGQAAVDDLANFATGGVTILTVDMAAP